MIQKLLISIIVLKLVKGWTALDALELKSLELFESVVKIVSKMIADKDIKTFIKPGGSPRFTVVDIGPIEEFSKITNQKQSLIKAIIDLELPQLVKKALRPEGATNGFGTPNIIVNPDEEKLDEKTKKRIFKKKLQLVDKYLITSDLKFSYLIKSSNKGYCLTGIDWEINEKIFDDVEGNLPNLKYALLKINTATSKDLPEGIFQDLFGSFGSNDSSTTFSCDISDIEYLIDTLQSVKTALAKEDKDVS